MRLVKNMPFFSVIDDWKDDCCLWQSDQNICDAKDDDEGVCDPSGMFYGTGDGREPKFCARHFYQGVVNGSGVASYRLEDR